MTAAAAGGLGAAENAPGPQHSNADVPQKHLSNQGCRRTKAARVEVKQPTKVEAKQPAKAKGPTSAHRYTSVHCRPCCSRYLGIFVAYTHGQCAVANSILFPDCSRAVFALRCVPDIAKSLRQLQLQHCMAELMRGQQIVTMYDLPCSPRLMSTLRPRAGTQAKTTEELQVEKVS